MRQHHRSASPYEKTIGFSRAVRVGERIYVSGTAPIEPDGSNTPGNVADQAERCFQLIAEAIESLGGSMSALVRTRMYLCKADDAMAVGRVHAKHCGAAAPAATMVVVAGLLDPAWRVEIEADALLDAPVFVK